MVRLVGKNRVKTAVFISGTGTNFRWSATITMY